MCPVAEKAGSSGHDRARAAEARAFGGAGRRALQHVALRFATVRPSYYHDWEPGLNKGRQLGILENYLSDLRDIKLSGEGVSELSYYPAPRRLLEEVGGGLKPKVRCFMNLKDHEAGLPACSRPSGVCFACGGRPLMR